MRMRLTAHRVISTPRSNRVALGVRRISISVRQVHGLAELAGADHTPYVGDSDALLDGIEEFLTGIRPVPSRIELWQQFFSPISSTLQAAEMGGRKWGEPLQQHHVLVRRSWRGSVAGRRTRRGMVS